jgi:hypothetical protein
LTAFIYHGIIRIIKIKEDMWLNVVCTCTMYGYGRKGLYKKAVCTFFSCHSSLSSCSREIASHLYQIFHVESVLAMLPTVLPRKPNGMVHAWVGQKLFKNYIFKSFHNVMKLSSGHHSNEYKCNRLPLLHK